jgi:hypothetical protein
MQALRDLLVRLGVLSSRLEALPPQLRLLLSEGFLECRSAAGQLDLDPVAFYSADKTAIDVVSETASEQTRPRALGSIRILRITSWSPSILYKLLKICSAPK